MAIMGIFSKKKDPLGPDAGAGGSISVWSQILIFVMKLAFFIIVVRALLVFSDGMSYAETAPQQAVAAASACFWLILARLIQAGYHHMERK